MVPGTSGLHFPFVSQYTVVLVLSASCFQIHPKVHSVFSYTVSEYKTELCEKCLELPTQRCSPLLLADSAGESEPQVQALDLYSS